MNKKQKRDEDLKRHYATLERLAKFLKAMNSDGKKLSLKLWQLEREAHDLATDYCNGVVDYDTWERSTEYFVDAVCAAFNVDEIPGLFINGDARGYAIKIDDAVMPEYESVGLHKDWGGYGILSPII